MKTTMLVLLFVLAVGTAFSQDTTATPYGNFYADSLKSTSYPATVGNGGPRDTVDVVVSSMFDVGYYQITAWSTAADTLVVSSLTPNGARYVQRGVVSLATGSTVASMVTGSTAVDFVIAGGTQTKLRFTSPGTKNAIYFIVAGRSGVVPGITASSPIVTSTISFKRPNNSTAYSAGDVVSDSATHKLRKFTNIVDYPGQPAQIVSALLMADTIIATNGTFRLHLFGDSTYSGVTADAANFYSVGSIADHAAFTLLDTSKTVYVGYIDFTLVAGAAGSTMCVAQNTAPGLYFTTRRYTTLWGTLVATAAYVPREYGTFTISLTVKR